MMKLSAENRSRLEGHVVVASVSGGKDSAAMSLWLTENGVEHRRVFADTGWEHPANLGKSIYDAAWGVFLRCLALKAEGAGAHLVAVDPRGTTKRCSRCGNDVPKALSEREHACDRCGLRLGRDHNAAINIHALGLSAATDGQQQRSPNQPKPLEVKPHMVNIELKFSSPQPSSAAGTREPP